MNDLSILDHIDPSQLDYQDWLSVGMAIKHEGGSATLWDQWSRRDSKRFREGECAAKWNGFQGSANPVTAGTLVEFAKQQGWVPKRTEHRELAWDDVISYDFPEDLRVIDPDFVEPREVVDPGDGWNPAQELIDYLNTLFESQEHVGYVTESWESDGRHVPKKGAWGRTAGELIQELSRCNGDIGSVVGDCNPEVGAWIRFNPLDGNGIRDDNVTSFRFALIESDTLDIERQAAIYAELELPIAALVHSGKKSLHAIVRIDAKDKEEYRDRVRFLHEVCRKNGLEVDTQNKNPSRLSRMPGVMRSGRKQHLVATNQGKATWEDWKDFVAEANDDLPEIESLSTLFDDLPPLAPPLIDGLLRKGHKMLLAGPSKAGKSYLLLQLAMGIAEGGDWIGWQCTQGKVLYVNLELDRASCLHRLKGLYAAKGWVPANVNNIDIWNLRGKAVPMDRLAPRLIRRSMKRGYSAIIIDPIYKVITGDENAADKMAHFCNQFDKVCAELGCAVIYCHHHSKGSQGQKSSRDRSSGSGVFARDPDAIIDLIELFIDANKRAVQENREAQPLIAAYLDKHVPDWRVQISQDDELVRDHFLAEAVKLLPAGHHEAIMAPVREVSKRIEQMSGWRIEGTLREYPPFPQKNVLFKHPAHIMDVHDVLKDAKADGEEAPWAKERRQRKEGTPAKKLSMKVKIMNQFSILEQDRDAVLIGDLADAYGKSVGMLTAELEKISDLALCSDNAVRRAPAAARFETIKAVNACKDMTGTVHVKDLIAGFPRTGNKGAGELSEDAVKKRLRKLGYVVEKGYVTGDPSDE